MDFFKKLLIPIAIICINDSYGQKMSLTDSIFQMKEFSVIGNRTKQFSPGNHIQTIDSSIIQKYSTGNIGDLISQNSNIQVNDQNGGLSSISIRGTGPNHTAILWNGLNLQDILNGMANMYLLPVNLFDEIDIQYGGNGALYGSGAIGGAINLNNSEAFNKGIQTFLATSAGSFSNYYESGGFTISRKNYIGNIRLYHQSAQNDYPYQVKGFADSLQKMKNDATDNFGILIDNILKINSKQKAGIHLWLQDNINQIPAAEGGSSLAHKKDKSYRVAADWSRQADKIDLFLRTALFNTFLNYDDAITKEHSLHQSLISVSECESNIKINRSNKLNFGLNYTMEEGISTNFSEHQLRNRASIFGSYKYTSKNNKFKIVLSLRDELINSTSNNPTFSAGLNKQLGKLIDIRTNVSRNYRVPTFNDLYWTAMGNPNLVPEKGFGEEIGFDIHPNKKYFPDFSLTFFNNNVTDWIIWLPDSTWHPHNLNSVWSRGIESNINYFLKLGQLNFILSGFYTYVLTTNETKISGYNPQLHKQLVNIPKNKIAANLTLEYKNYSFTFSECFVGLRYSEADNSASVDPYTICNIIVSKKINLQNFAICLDARINNIFDQSYEIIKNYPMPMRNYQIGLKILFNKPNKLN